MPVSLPLWLVRLEVRILREKWAWTPILGLLSLDGESIRPPEFVPEGGVSRSGRDAGVPFLLVTYLWARKDK